MLGCQIGGGGSEEEEEGVGAEGCRSLCQHSAVEAFTDALV